MDRMGKHLKKALAIGVGILAAVICCLILFVIMLVLTSAFLFFFGESLLS